MEQYYIGKKKVLSLVDTNRTTPLGKKMLQVCFEDGTYEYMPERRFEIIKTTDPTDASIVRGMLVTYVTKEVGSVVYGMLVEYGARLGEIEPICNQVVAMTNAGTERVSDILWAVDYADQRTLNQVNDILIANVTKTSNDGATSSGAGTDIANQEKV